MFLSPIASKPPSKESKSIKSLTVFNSLLSADKSLYGTKFSITSLLSSITIFAKINSFNLSNSKTLKLCLFISTPYI